MSAVAPFAVCFPQRSRNGTGDTYATTGASVGSTTVVELSFGEPYAKVKLSRFKVKWVSGTGTATFTPYLFSKSGVTTAGDIAQEYAGAATAVATLFDPDVTSETVIQADANGKLYLRFAPDAGSDNVFQYALRFLVYR